MHKRWIELIVTVIVVLFVPLMILGIFNDGTKQETTQELSTENTVEERTEQTTEENTKDTISVLLQDASVTQMPVNSYVLGVVLAEMPADFHEDALKAQAVVARTYALKRLNSNEKHSAAVCTDSNCCQAYITAEEYLYSKGTKNDLQKIEAAVEGTQNLVLVYNGRLIDSTYFSCSGGSTEDAAAVWGEYVPYLQAVESPGEECSAYYTDTVTVSVEDFRTILGLQTDIKPQYWIGDMTYTNGGGIDTINIAGVSYSGVELRRLLGLRSTAFTMTVIGDAVVITTRGFGHRVGMSQYGAAAMAEEGNTFDQILQHYYPNTELMTYNGAKILD